MGRPPVVKHVFVGQSNASHEASGCVQHALWLAGGPRSVQLQRWRGEGERKQKHAPTALNQLGFSLEKPLLALNSGSSAVCQVTSHRTW